MISHFHIYILHKIKKKEKKYVNNKKRNIITVLYNVLHTYIYILGENILFYIYIFLFFQHMYIYIYIKYILI